GLDPGCNADMVILQAEDPMEAVRLRAHRLFVIRRGEVIASSSEVMTEIKMGDTKSRVAFRNGELPNEMI
ncbi:MAG: cytosine deaminase, partial [Gammaproteobacteria bacterium]|nr:cytosine deaminase [Gammaproteobacteria bacterium]